MTSDPQPPQRTGHRRTGLLLLTVVVLLAAAGYFAWWTLVGSKRVTTDNAYVQGNIVQVTTQLSGTVLAIHADDTDLVHAGQPLVTLDDTDSRVTLEQAEAQLGQTVREVRALFANVAALESEVVKRKAEHKRARTDLARAEGDLERRQGLLASGAVGREEVQHAKAAVAAARSAVDAAQAAIAATDEQLKASRVLTDGTEVREHPNVRRAAARVEEAWLALSRTTLPAPITGHVARRSVQLGQRLNAGTTVMSVIPLDQVWVEANFKESQLRHIRIGQPVQLVADLYGDDVRFEGRVQGLAAGTGAVFALLPAQNATGNWIKVVQRVPVRIALDSKQTAEHPLRIGLSMEARIDITERDGPALADTPRTQPLASTDVYQALARGARERIEQIVAANLAPSPR